MRMAEELIPRLRVADWLDRAEAAQRQLEHLDLRDLRSVVAASDDPVVARDESTRELATALKAALVTKQDEELTLWLADVEAALDVGRVVRALRLSSVPPKAGVPFPGALATRLGEATTASLQPGDGPDRWSAVLEAAAFSPVRSLVAPTAAPEQRSDELVATVRRLAPLLPQVAALFDIEVAARRRRAQAAAPDDAPPRHPQEGRPQARPLAPPTPAPDSRRRPRPRRAEAGGAAGRGRRRSPRSAEVAAPSRRGRRRRRSRPPPIAESPSRPPQPPAPRSASRRRGRRRAAGRPPAERRRDRRVAGRRRPRSPTSRRTPTPRADASALERVQGRLAATPTRESRAPVLERIQGQMWPRSPRRIEPVAAGRDRRDRLGGPTIGGHVRDRHLRGRWPRRRHHAEPPGGPQRRQRRRGHRHGGGDRPPGGRRRRVGRHPHRQHRGPGPPGVLAPAPTSRRSTPATARHSAPSGAGSPASSTASAASR